MGAGGYLVLLSAFGVLGVLTGTVGVLQSTGWFWRYYRVIEEYCGVLSGMAGCYRVSGSVSTVIPGYG